MRYRCSGGQDKTRAALGRDDVGCFPIVRLTRLQGSELDAGQLEPRLQLLLRIQRRVGIALRRLIALREILGAGGYKPLELVRGRKRDDISRRGSRIGRAWLQVRDGASRFAAILGGHRNIEKRIERFMIFARNGGRFPRTPR